MAEVHAVLIAEEFGGKVDLVFGEDYGGLIGLHLAARHPDRLTCLATASPATRSPSRARHS
ncbi:MAG: alpha/beta fold hydrolase, partial [Propionicimonas sp.]